MGSVAAEPRAEPSVAGPSGRLWDVPVTILDGKGTAAAIRAELTDRVAALTAAGHRPGLGTLLVGDDPASRSYP